MTQNENMFWAMSLILGDLLFLDKWREHLKSEMVPKGPMRFLLAAALLQFDEHRQLLDEPSLIAYTSEVDEDEGGEARQVFKDLKDSFLLTEANYAISIKLGEAWIQDVHLRARVDRAGAALDAGHREEAFASLLGAETLQGKVVDPPMDIDAGDLSNLLAERFDTSRAIPTGLRALDKKWAGGIYPGNLGIVLAPTNIGKTMMLCYLAAMAYAANKRVLYFTYELTRVQILERILGALFMVGPEHLDDADTRILAIRQGLDLDRATLHVDNGIETFADLKKRLEEDEFDLVVLDSADDMVAQGKDLNAYAALGEIYTDIAIKLCQQMGLAVWTSTQATREAMDKKYIGLGMMGDSFKKAQRAHLIFGLSQTKEELEELTGPVLKVQVLKDTLHGTRGVTFRYTTRFGRGSGGYPGFELADIGGMV